MTRRDEPSRQVGTPSDTNTASGLAISWLEWLLNIKGRQPRTAEAYGLTLEKWVEWAHANGVDPLHPDVTEIEAFTLRPRTRQGHGRRGAASTRRTEIVALRGWFEWMVRRGHVKADPTVDLEAPTVRGGLPKPIPDADWLALVQAQITPRLRLALGLGFYCGLRREEIVELRGNQVTAEHIVDFTRKGGSQDTLPWRTMVGIHEDHMPRLLYGDFEGELLEHARSSRGNPMFWTEGQSMYKYMTRACKRAEIPHYTPHQLRHSCASNLVNVAKVDLHLVASMLHHSSIDMTRRYIRAGGDELAEWRRLNTRKTAI